MKPSSQTLKNINWRLLPIQTGIVLTFLMSPFWLKFQDAPAPFTATYITGFVIIVPILWTISTWVLTGFPGWQNLISTYPRLLWSILLLLLTLWVTYSQGWAFIRDTEPGVAQNGALQIWLLSGFLIVMACAAPSTRTLLRIFVFNMLLHGLIGGIQVAIQGSIGLDALGEFGLDVAKSGVSVIQTGDLRWLRPYGLTPHPNIFAGVILSGVCAAVSFTMHPRPRFRLVAYLCFLFGFWLLMLTFSRGAWLGFAIGAVLVLPLAFGMRHAKWRLIPLMILTAELAFTFFLLYQPLIMTRTATATENTEMRSIADRVVFTEIAFSAIESQPILGVGAGNYPWYASHYLFYHTDYDLRGDNVHNVYLLIFAEFGLIGISLFTGILGVGFIILIQTIRREMTIDKLVMLALFIAFFMIALFDHYLWSMLPFAILWPGLPAITISRQPVSRTLHGSVPTDRDS